MHISYAHISYAHISSYLGGTTLGGYTNSPWTSDQDGYSKADKAFLFVLEGSTAPRKLKLMNKQDSQAIYNEATYGPAFGEHMISMSRESMCSLNYVVIHMNLVQHRSY